MTTEVRFATIKFRNYKAFKSYSLSLSDFNVVVGPNNAGKSTVVGAFRILAEGLRRALARGAEYVDARGVRQLAYPIALEGLPVSTENVFHNYDDAEPATVEFVLSNRKSLRLVFADQDRCFMTCEHDAKPIQTPKQFRSAFDVSVKFVPVLGPVEHDEPLYQREAARNALLSHGASRNFRNIWHHYPDGFERFRALVRETWPGMDIDRPELSGAGTKRPTLHMFCPENRVPREIYWAGFGFQVWCQMLTYISQASDSSLLVIDEPDIYLHSDLQRQLVHLLRTLGPDILLATHSTEIISEADPGELVLVNKKWRSARRVKSPQQIQEVFGALGSNLNPTLTQLAKTRRAVFVEGKDFSVISGLARKLGYHEVANRASFAVVPSEGFNVARVRDFSEGMESTLGSSIAKAVVFDRDYRPDEVVNRIYNDLSRVCAFVHIHDRKELENHLLIPNAVDRAIRARLSERQRRGAVAKPISECAETILLRLTDDLKSDLFGQFSAAGTKALLEFQSGVDPATATGELHREFERRWATLEERLKLVPGKHLLARLNAYLQSNYDVTLSVTSLVGSITAAEVSDDMKRLVVGLHAFAGGEHRG